MSARIERAYLLRITRPDWSFSVMVHPQMMLEVVGNPTFEQVMQAHSEMSAAAVPEVVRAAIEDLMRYGTGSLIYNAAARNVREWLGAAP